MAKKPPKFEALVVNAIRRLQAAQGSTETEIASYLSQEYNVSGPEVRKQIQLTLRRGMNYGILHKSKRGYVTCDHNIPDVLDVADSSRRRGSRRRSHGRSHGRKRKSSRPSRSSRSSRPSRPSRRGRSRSKHKKHGACKTCPRRRAAIPAGVRKRAVRTRPRVKPRMTRPRVKPRMTRRAPPRAAREKVKKTPSSEETTPPANSKPHSKSPRDPRTKGEEKTKS